MTEENTIQLATSLLAAGIGFAIAKKTLKGIKFEKIINLKTKGIFR